MVHISRVGLQVGHIHDASLLLGYAPLSVPLHELDRGQGHLARVVGRVQADYLLALAVLHHRLVRPVVVSEEYDVKSRHLLGHPSRGVLRIVLRHDAAVPSRVEEADDHVRMLPILHLLDGSPCRGHHVVEAQSAPQILLQPTGDGWRDHADDRHLHLAVLAQHAIGQGVGLSRLRVDDVGSQNWRVALPDPFVIDPVARLHVVVAQRLCVIL